MFHPISSHTPSNFFYLALLQPATNVGSPSVNASAQKQAILAGTACSYLLVCFPFIRHYPPANADFTIFSACTFLGPSKKRGPPKGYIDAIEARLHQSEALLGVLLASEDSRATTLFRDLAQVRGTGR